MLPQQRDGNLRGFQTAEARWWAVGGVAGGELFRVAHRWVLLGELASSVGLPGRFLDDGGALAWLTTNDYEPPEDPGDYAEGCQLR